MAQQSKALAPIDQFRRQLASDANRQKIVPLLPKTIPPERFLKAAESAVSMNPDLLSADRGSLFQAIAAAARDGLICDGRESVITTFKTKNRQTGQWEPKATYMPMVAGLIKKARNTGQLTRIEAHPVFANDEFEYVLGDDSRLRHVPNLDDPGDFRLVYAVAHLADGSVQREVITRKGLEKIRQASKSADRGPWADWFEEMARKSAIKRLLKYLPSSPEIESSVRLDDTAGSDDQGTVIDGLTGEVIEQDHSQDQAPRRRGAASAALEAMDDSDAIDAGYEEVPADFPPDDDGEIPADDPEPAAPAPAPAPAPSRPAREPAAEDDSDQGDQDDLI